MTLPRHRPMRPGPRTSYEESWLAGAELGEALTRGWRPRAQPVQIALGAGEAVLAQAPVRVWQYIGQNVTYNQGWFVAFGSPLLLGASLLGSALYNGSQRRRAEALAAVQWRPVCQGHLFLTNWRLALALTTGWIDIGYPYLRASGVDGDSMVIMLAGQPPVRLQVWPAHWFFVLMRFLAYGEIVRMEIPSHLQRAAAPRALEPPSGS
ncbi:MULTISPECIES: hypothetical protein [unclassified Frankia]|uniref:hypothetical protein n=1 Tax=unclassified Frankia TaxID=2632575 RepID=UPI001F47E4CB|nr:MULTISPECIES: hypothetical protein [unclassified Frankia]